VGAKINFAVVKEVGDLSTVDVKQSINQLVSQATKYLSGGVIIPCSWSAPSQLK
jgi:hypothetical protein